MCGLAELEQPLGDDRSRKVGREVDNRLAPDVRKNSGRCREVGAELGIEGVGALKQESESPLRRVGPHPALRSGAAWKPIAPAAARTRSPVGLAHAVPGIQHAIDSGDADMRGAREIRDGGATAQAWCLEL